VLGKGRTGGDSAILYGWERRGPRGIEDGKAGGGVEGSGGEARRRPQGGGEGAKRDAVGNLSLSVSVDDGHRSFSSLSIAPRLGRVEDGVGTGGTSVGHVCWSCVGWSPTGEKEKVPECLEIEWLPVSRDARGRRIWEQSRASVGSRSEESPGTNVPLGGPVICWLHWATVAPLGRKKKNVRGEDGTVARLSMASK